MFKMNQEEDSRDSKGSNWDYRYCKKIEVRYVVYPTG